MVDLKTDLTWIPIQTDDAEFRIQMFYRQLAEMVVEQKLVEAGQDSRETPVDLPLVSDTVPSPPDNSRILEA